MTTSGSAMLAQLKNETEELQDLNFNNKNILSAYLSVKRLISVMNSVRKHSFTLERKSTNTISEYHKIHKSLLDIEFELDFKIRSRKLHYSPTIEVDEAKVGKSSNREPLHVIQIISPEDDEPIDSLKQRLLSTGNEPSQLDSIHTAQIQNEKHESFQKEMIDSLPLMVSSLKNQTSKFQQMLKEDAIILKEASENFESSKSVFDRVNTTLSKYHREGRLGLWFYVRVILFVFLTFAFFIFLIRLIPARY
ncbi:hypothetical protein KL938_005068 [Ogataea parapolymorpha]|nr:hypothetical protein KL938_005068 [Ogataea parapolymorpha]